VSAREPTVPTLLPSDEESNRMMERVVVEQRGQLQLPPVCNHARLRAADG